MAETPSPVAPSPSALAAVSPGPSGLSPAPNAGPEETLFEGSPALIPGLGALIFAVLTVGLGLVYLWWRRQGLRYRITTQRIVVDRGLFSKTLDQVDLYRISDFVVERPFGQRLLGTGNIRLRTLEKSAPELELGALPTDVVALYEKMRVAVEAAKQARAVRVVDME